MMKETGLLRPCLFLFSVYNSLRTAVTSEAIAHLPRAEKEGGSAGMLFRYSCYIHINILKNLKSSKLRAPGTDREIAPLLEQATELHGSLAIPYLFKGGLV